MRDRFALLMIALFCLLFGVGLLRFGVAGLIREFRANDWPRTSGIIVGTQISGGEGRNLWCAHWIYGYMVNKHIYAGSRTHLEASSCHRRKIGAENELKSHPLGSKVSIVYDPENPQNAALGVSADRGAFWWFLNLAGIAFVCSAIAIFRGRGMTGHSIGSPAAPTDLQR
jgi:hypothetical protein